MTTTITTTLHSSVTLGAGTYTSPLSITSTGGIDPSSNDGATALLISNPGTVTNSGVITGDAGLNGSGFADANPGGTGGVGVAMYTGTFTNSKQITGGKGGEVSDFLSTASTKDGAGGYGLSLTGGTFINTGTITGGSGGSGNLQGDNGVGGGALGGVGGYGVSLASGTLINTGTIAGGAGGANYVGGAAGSGTGGQGVTMTGGVFIDAGAIISHGAGFVVSGTNTATVIIESGASFTDDEYSHDSNATLAVGGTTPFVLAAIGTDERFYGFQHLSFASTLSGFGLAGDALGLASGQTIAGMIAGDNITLTGFAATTESFVTANELVLKNSSGTTETIGLAGFTTATQLLFSTDGSNTTLTAAVQTISTSVTNAVTLGSGTYAQAVTITNTGAVTGPAGAAGGSTTSGTAGSTAVLLNAVSDTLTNSGVVTGGAGGSAPSSSAESGGGGGAGVALSAGLLVNAGNITGGAGGAYGYAGGTGKSGAGGAGVSTTGAATIINSGNISGGQAGVNISVVNDPPFGSFTHLKSSNIGGVGIALSTGSTLMNSGAITGANAATIYSTSRAQAGAAGVSLAGSGQVTNSSSGVITGGTGGGSQNAFFQPGGGGNGGTGLVSGAGETLLNQGHITGGNGGYAWQSSAGNGGTGLSASSGDVITNTGVITGGNGAKEDRFQGEPNLPGANGAGVYLNGGTLINAGTIAGGTYAGQGNAVSFGATAATLVVENGAVFNGNIVANSAVADVLAFAGGSPTIFSGIGTSAENVNQISFAAGAAWTIEGNAAGLASGETITGFTSTDALILDSFAATSETLSAGSLTLGNGSAFETLNLGASTDHFVILNNGTNSTITEAPASLSLSSGTYLLSGQSAGLTGTSITGFAAGDTINLEGFSATSETYQSGIGLVLGNGTSFDTLNVNSFSGIVADSTDGTNTTITAKPLVSIISTHIGAVGGNYSYVTLGNGHYANSLTITSSGAVGHPFGATDISDAAGQTGITLVNQGQIDNADMGVDFVNAAYVNNSGTILTQGAGITLQNGGTIVNSGQIQGSPFGYTVWLTKGGTIINAGYIGGNDAIYSRQSLTLIEQPGQSADSESKVRVGSSDGNVIFAAGASSLDMTQFYGFSNISFATNAAWDTTIQPDLNNFDGVSITGFTQADTIDLKNFIVVSDSFANGVLTVNGKYGGSYQLDIAGNVSATNFIFTSDGNSGTDFTLCYLRGTRILTPSGEVAVEDLAIGDDVATRFGGAQQIKWIGRQSFSPRFVARNPAKQPIRITANALGANQPERDLLVSPGHSILIGTQLILASALVNGITIRQETASTQVDYFNIELASHDCVLAEGAWSETYADGPGLRAQFHNAAEFWTLYPDYQTPEALPLCAPRPQAGPALEAALRRSTARATAAITQGPLEGFIDTLTAEKITGWARDLTHPHLPVKLDVMLGETLITTILACDPRDDLDNLGYGPHAFSLTIADPLTPAERASLRIVRSADGTPPPANPGRQSPHPRGLIRFKNISFHFAFYHPFFSVRFLRNALLTIS